MESPSPPDNLSTAELSLEQKQRQDLLNDPAIYALLKESLQAKKNAELKKAGEKVKGDDDWIKKSPYYQERYALFIKPTIDAMIGDREPRCFSYSRFPKQKPATLYSLVSQAFRYLIDYFDDDKETYALFRGEVEICREATGVHIYFKAAPIDIITGEPYLADKIAPKAEQAISKWRKKLYEYLEDETQTRFYEDKLALSADHIDEIKTLVENIPTIMYYIKPSHIRLFRGTEEQIKMMKEAAKDIE